MRARGTATRLVPVVAVLAVVAALGLAMVVRSLVDPAGEDNANGSVPVRGVAVLQGTWTAVNDVGAPAAAVQGSRVALTFEGTSLRATTGCNALTGSVRVVDSTLVVDDLGATDMGCEPTLMRQQEWIAEMLQARPRLELSGPTLSLLWDEHWLGLSSEPAG
ncbi:META domain-containing protein [Knoellia sp. 3-2P3]|uniref:META domain-containing protein n=1 Tax=unclassified Knoellia TaxID=2618719 RepID=UPI0023DA68D9|nr:META domain-containing protein [Knoellia sp. 3-2P3]MDF2092721.1 META domain-containing protein [Knoellia sp. 3-2P3]